MSESIIKEIIKALPSRTTSTFANSIKHLLECKLCKKEPGLTFLGEL